MSEKKSPSRCCPVWAATGAALSGLTVAMGAFGAHGLESHLESLSLEPQVLNERLEWWVTGTRYQMFHVLGILAIGVSPWRNQIRLPQLLFLAGIIIFCGCLYAMALGGPKFLGAIVPIGGTCMIAGWVALTVAFVKADRHE